MTIGLVDGDVLLNASMWETKDFNDAKKKTLENIEKWCNVLGFSLPIIICSLMPVNVVHLPSRFLTKAIDEANILSLS